MIGMILKWLSAGLLDRLLTHLEKRLDRDTETKRIAADVVKEEIQAEMQARAEARKVLIAESGHFWSGVCLDSLLHLGLRVAEVPVLREWGGAIIASLFLVDGVQSVARGMAARFTK
ncbi:hypothetical protein [Roseibium litorale]|uniref:Holin of 3TMs, for gene-transfer release n=1 Tax=Roseibium litorale TaxID=2803841 RepID=A0ABR9CTI6_9HYPH|nr:hypothetical protein [Roseibium litorale]MBD8894048.1 hypothetical protein [Roseibium litorale]